MGVTVPNTNGCCTLDTALTAHLNAPYTTQAQNVRGGLSLVQSKIQMEQGDLLH